MAEEEKKKPKIDLKARLGKKTVGSVGPSIPPPMSTGGSIPAPPFASQAAAQQPEAPKPAPPQEIKIEMSEEVVAAQKKGRTKVILLVIGAAVVGGFLGNVIGDGRARQTRQNIALQGAELLVDEVDTANVEIEKLGDILTKVKRGLSNNEYPEKAISELSEVNIPFNGNNLVGKGTGLMGAEVNRLLVKFAGAAETANDQKDGLRSILSRGKKPITELLSQRDKPKFNWSVYIDTRGAHGPVAKMQPLPEPFLVDDKDKKDYEWPEEIELPLGKDKTEKLKRYQKGDPTKEAFLIPVEPSTQRLVCSVDTLTQIRREVVGLERTLKGDNSDPTNEKKGLASVGKNLMDKLKDIGH
jgi:hypothetical protein